MRSDFSSNSLFLLESAIFATCRFVDSKLNKILFKNKNIKYVRKKIAPSDNSATDTSYTSHLRRGDAIDANRACLVAGDDGAWWRGGRP